MRRARHFFGRRAFSFDVHRRSGGRPAIGGRVEPIAPPPARTIESAADAWHGNGKNAAYDVRRARHPVCERLVHGRAVLPGGRVLSVRQLDGRRTPKLEVVEGSASPPAAVVRLPQPNRSAQQNVPAVLLLIASLAILWQGGSAASLQAGAPSLLAGAALGAASLLLLSPLVWPRLTQLLALEQVVVVALGGAAFLLTRTGVPEFVLLLAFGAIVAGLGLWRPANATMPVVGALAVLAGYFASSWLGVSPSILAVLAVVTLTTTLSNTRSHQAAAAASARLGSAAEDVERLRAESSSTREASDVATAVLAVARAFAAAVNPAEIADQIVRSSTQHVHGAGALLLLWDDAVETFRIGAIHGRDLPGSTDLRQVEIRPDTIPTLRPAANGEVVEVEPGAVREPMLASLLRRWKANALLGVRLQRGDQLLGLLFAARAEGQARFLSRDFNVLTGIAVHAAAALDHAALIADLQSANQLKEEFMATMSHELRTPLNVIIGYTDLQMEGAFGDLPEDHLDTLRTVREQALQLLELIQATLDMSRLERGLVTVDLRDVSVTQFVEQLRVQVPPAWRKPTVQLNWRVEPGLPPIRTDPAKLQIILRNLIHNALKFTHHGMVSVSVSTQPARRQMTFVVQDSGIGIKSENLSEIFEMFRQAHTGEVAPAGGVGLGLYIVKRLAAVLGAEIEVSSAPGRGATFRIHLPLAGPLAARS
jgi:signal transduction histidine kinase